MAVGSVEYWALLKADATVDCLVVLTVDLKALYLVD